MFQQIFQFGQGSDLSEFRETFDKAGTPSKLVRTGLQFIEAVLPKREKDIREFIERTNKALPGSSEDENMVSQSLDDHFVHMKRCLELSSNSKVVHATLLVLDKFISSDIIIGAGHALPPSSDSSVPNLSGEAGSSREGTPPLASHKILLDDIVYAVSDCVRRNSQDESIQLAAIKCVISAVTSRNRLVHGSSLMTCIRMCYSINKDSKSVSAQSAATDALTQMLNAVIVSLERSVDPSIASERSAAIIADWTDSYTHQLINKTVLLHESCNEGKYGWCVVCDSPANYHCLKTRDPICSWSCKRENLNRANLIVSSSPSTSSQPQSDLRHSIEYQDVLSVFRSLCKLSAGTGGNPVVSGPFSTAIPDIRIVKAKRLSLELISAMLESSGPTLKSDPGFIEMIQHVLIVSLLTNSVSPVPKIFNIALNIFAQLLRDFKRPLIREIGIFIDKVFLYILESENASFAHKLKVLEIFNSLCFDAKSAIELFQFFDCAIGERNVFELSVNCLAGIALGRFASTTTFSGPPDAAPPPSVGLTANLSSLQQDELKNLALNSILSLIDSTSKWLHQDHQISTTPIPVASTALTSQETGDDEEDHDISRTTTPPPGIAKQRKDQKNLLETALELFRSKPAKGIDSLVEHGFIAGKSPATIAKALKELPNLDKTAIGDYLGEYQEENLKIFYAFVELFDFTNMELDIALRHFLSFFRLPGEAQKIDRIMEKFAEKFFKNNPSKFPNADCAYVLSFAVIMLNTDLHSTQVKKKMTLEEFVKLGKGINTEIEINEKELVRLYKSVEADEIKLIDNTVATAAIPPSASGGQTDTVSDPIAAQRRRFELFIRETEKMVETTRSELANTNTLMVPTSRQTFTGTIKVQRKSSPANIPAPVLGDIPSLLLAVSYPIMHTLKFTLLSPSVTSEDGGKIFNSWKNFILICSHFPEDLDTIKSELFKQLFSICLRVSLKDPVIDLRGIEAVQVMADLVSSRPTLVVQNWTEIIALFSIIDRWNYLRFRLKASAAASNESSSEPLNQAAHAPSSIIFSLVGGAKKWWYSKSSSSVPNTPLNEIADLSPIERDNLDVVVSCTTDALDKIDSVFNQSSGLSPMSVLNLVRALVEVSKTSEISASPPRLFCLQKLVEVADFNMHRIRIVWSKIWAEIHPYLVLVASSSSAASFAIDALRQLAMKYLVKAELSNYHFQAEFLRPFLIIMTNHSTNITSKNLVMDIVCSLAKTVPQNIKSGWVSLFSIAQIAAASSAASDLVHSCLDFVSTINSNLQIKMDYFREFFEILTILVNRQKDLSPNLIEQVWNMISSNIRNLIDGDMKPNLNELNKGGIWLTVFQTLTSILVNARSTDLREKASNVLFNDLIDPEGRLDNETVRIFIRGVLVPLFDDQVHVDDPRDSLIIEIAQLYASVCGKNFQRNFYQYIPETFSVYQIMLDSRHSDKLAQSAIDMIRSLVLPNIVFLTNHNTEWNQLCECMSRFIDSTIPAVLMDHAGGKHVDLVHLPFDPQEVMNVCVAHLSVLALVLDMVEIIERGKREQTCCSVSVAKMVGSVERSYDFAVQFNAETGLRERLKRLGFMRDLRQLPKLIKQEILGLNILLRVFSTQKEDSKRLRNIIVALVDEFVEKERMLHSVSVQVQDHVHEEIEGSIAGFNTLISGQIIDKIFGHMSQDDFVINREWIFDLLVKLIPSNDMTVRKAVADCLAKRFRPLPH